LAAKRWSNFEMWLQTAAVSMTGMRYWRQQWRYMRWRIHWMDLVYSTAHYLLHS